MHVLLEMQPHERFKSLSPSYKDEIGPHPFSLVIRIFLSHVVCVCILVFLVLDSPDLIDRLFSQ